MASHEAHSITLAGAGMVPPVNAGAQSGERVERGVLGGVLRLPLRQHLLDELQILLRQRVIWIELQRTLEMRLRIGQFARSLIDFIR